MLYLYLSPRQSSRDQNLQVASPHKGYREEHDQLIHTLLSTTSLWSQEIIDFCCFKPQEKKQPYEIDVYSDTSFENTQKYPV